MKETIKSKEFWEGLAVGLIIMLIALSIIALIYYTTGVIE